MAEPSRGLQISRRGWLLASLVAPLFRARAADSLIISYDGDNLHVSSLGLHFLKGKSLSHLKDGSTVEYMAQVALFHDREQFVTPFRRSEFRFVVSCDIWGTGNQFTVATVGQQARRAANLSLSAAETWCLERVIVPTAGMAQDRPFWLQLELRTLPPKPDSVLGEKSLTVDLIELWSRIPGADERQVFGAGPLYLNNLRGPRKGGG